MRGGWTPLNSAAEKGRAECVKSLLAAEANKDHATINGHTPIDSAAENFIIFILIAASHS